MLCKMSNIMIEIFVNLYFMRYFLPGQALQFHTLQDKYIILFMQMIIRKGFSLKVCCGWCSELNIGPGSIDIGSVSNNIYAGSMHSGQMLLTFAC